MTLDGDFGALASCAIVSLFVIQPELSVSELNGRSLRTVIPAGSFVEPGGGGGGVACTLTVAVPVFVSLVAVMVADPTPTAVTSPDVGLTAATLVFPLDHVTLRPVSTLLLASRAVAES